jgi:hypothetical protein
MKSGSKGFDGVKILKLRGEWMFGQCYACLIFVGFKAASRSACKRDEPDWSLMPEVGRK